MVRAISFSSPDGRTLASVAEDAPHVMLWHTATEEEVRRAMGQGSTLSHA